MEKDTFLSPRQMEVLILRAQGRSQKEVAELLGTTRENVSILEKRARANVERARRTLDAFEALDPVVVRVERGTDIFQVPEQVFRKADRHGISLVHTKTSLIAHLRLKAADRIWGNRLTEDLEISILRSGKVWL